MSRSELKRSVSSFERGVDRCDLANGSVIATAHRHGRRAWKRRYTAWFSRLAHHCSRGADEVSLHLSTAAYLLYMRFVFLTSSVRYVSQDRIEERGNATAIGALLHQETLISLYAFRRTRSCVMLTEHPNAEPFVRIAQRLQIRVVRGGSDAGGGRALLKMIKMVRDEDCNGSIIVDGPGGPPGTVKMGIVLLAKHARRPIIPIRALCTRSLHLKTWDKRILPLPFNKLTLICGDPVHVPEQSTSAERESLREDLEERLRVLQQRPQI